MKHIKRIIALLLVLVITVCFINAGTDFFLNFGSYAPAIEERNPELTGRISYWSERLSTLTDYIPTPSELMAMIKREELPIDPSDVAANAYIENSPLLTFYPRENIGIIVDFNTVQLFGVISTRDKAHLIADFSDESSETLDQIPISADNDGNFNRVMDIPETDSQIIRLAVFTGSKAYGQFESWVYNYITLVKTPDGGWELLPSPVYENNKALYEKDKSISRAKKSTDAIQSDSNEIISIARQLTDGIENDYDKILALHDWVCSYMYYDVDSLTSDERPPYYSTEIIRSGRAVCEGFATLFAALCRSIDIPCNVVTGYALGVGEDTEWTDETVSTDEQNHAWNEAYVDGRWVIVDTTWDCTNKINGGEAQKGSGVSHIYFDANLQFFSANHRITDYTKRS